MRFGRQFWYRFGTGTSTGTGVLWWGIEMAIRVDNHFSRWGYWVDRVANYTYFTARPKYLNPLNWLRRRNESRAEGMVRAHHYLYDTIRSVRTACGSTGCEYSDYLELYSQILRRRPACILELGSGVSTAVIALALQELAQPAVFVSVDESPEWLDRARKALSRNLAPLVRFHYSPRIERPYGKWMGCCYESLPDFPWDFVFIDGPVPRRPGGPKCFNSDILNLPVLPHFAMLDQRILTYQALKDLLPGMRVRYHPIKKITTIEG